MTFWKETMWRLVILLTIVLSVDCVVVGQIQDAQLTGDDNEAWFNQTREQCICEMVKSNGLILALNYFVTNQTCQFFFFNVTNIRIEFYMDCLVIYVNQSAIFNMFRKLFFHICSKIYFFLSRINNFNVTIYYYISNRLVSNSTRHVVT